MNTQQIGNVNKETNVFFFKPNENSIVKIHNNENGKVTTGLSNRVEMVEERHNEHYNK